jgi:hypothetical protein
MAEDATKKLEMRVAELENTLKTLVGLGGAGTTSALPTISHAEMETYLKVKGIVEPGACAPCMAGCVRLCFIMLACVRQCFQSGSGGTSGGSGGTGDEGGGFGSLGG